MPDGHDYHGRTLTMCNFSGQDLTNANFQGATLTAVVFLRTNLTGANFSNATIGNAICACMSLNPLELGSGWLRGPRAEIGEDEIRI